MRKNIPNWLIDLCSLLGIQWARYQKVVEVYRLLLEIGGRK